MLVGIAKLASSSPLLDAKREVEYFDLPIRSLINKVRKGLPFEYAINPYRGCEFGCKYCYARYTHEFMELREGRLFEEKIYSKAGAALTLKRDLAKIERSAGIAIGTATDPYQPAERRYETTRSILEVFAADRGRRVSIITKSDLILRDVELLKEVARGNVLHVTVTITTLDASLARALEPKAPRPDLRLGAVRALASSGLRVGVNANPVMPLITDSEDSLDKLIRAAAGAGADSFGGGILFLQPCAQKVFFPFLEERFPHLARKYRERFQASPYLRGAAEAVIKDRVRRLRGKYGIGGAPVEYQPELVFEPDQMTLF